MKNYFGAPIKKLGFGFMRLPTIAGKGNADIDYELTNKMADKFLERGFTYFDTAFMYHGGNSEIAIRKALTERHDRDKFQVTTKLPLWQEMTLDEMREKTQTQFDRTGLDHFDLYFLHGIGPDKIEMMNKMKVWDYLRSLKESGKAKNIGFSYHGDTDTLNRVLGEHSEHLDIIQLPINYLDWEALGKGQHAAALAHDVGIIVMTPIKGGALANFTPEVAGVFKQANSSASVASWALRFALHLEGVVSVLSGMSDLDQVEDNINIADTTGPLSDDEMAVISKAMAEKEKIPTIPCTKCKYCLDCCPQNINTPAIIGLVNEYTLYRSFPSTKRSYEMVTEALFGGIPAKSSQCTECGECERHCPHGIEIIKAHKEAAELFE
ncbi:MAG: aldo/keto reductase [Oscillospiraceae bacterium]|nr:aldo/keto reductase [Oscillospiraceae bacterium]